MKINRKELCNILSMLRPGLHKKENVQQSCHFIFLDNKIAVYNDKISITHPFECEEQFSVKGEEFFRLINGITDESIDVTLKDSKIKIKSKNTSANMATLSEDQNVISAKINTLEENMKKWKPLPPDFTEAISLCGFSASSDLSTGIRSCVCIIGDKCYSVDGSRGSSYTFKEEVEDILNIPIIAAIELIKFPITEYCFSNNWLCFKTEDDVIFSCASIDGDFPAEKLETVFSQFEDLPVIELPSELKQTVEEVLMLASDDETRAGKLISIVLEEGTLTVTANNDLGSVEKVIDVDFEEEPITMTINSTFLSQILSKSVEMYVSEKWVFFAMPDFRHAMAKLETPKKPKSTED